MIVLGISMGIIGIITAAISAFFYTSGHEPSGIAGMVMGTGLFVMGILIFLANLVLRLARRGFDLLLRGRFYSIDVKIRGRLTTSSEEDRGTERDSDLLRGDRADRRQMDNMD
jgi:hypothetical protein